MKKIEHEKYMIWENNAGWCVLGWTEKGVCFFQFGFRTAGEAGKAAGKNGEKIPLKAAPDLVWMAKVELDRYFRGEKTPLKIPLDWTGHTEFQRAVWRAAMRIPYGGTCSYMEIARATGKPGAARAAGSALGVNPIPVIVPCHRVLRSGGGLGGFATGLAVKQALLDLEKGTLVNFRGITFERK